MLASTSHCKVLRQRFLCHGIGTVRLAILYGDRSCYGIWKRGSCISNNNHATMFQLGKMRMELPSRTRLCTHLQCFDAKTFLMMNEKKARWMCPVCDKSLLLQELYIDG